MPLLTPKRKRGGLLSSDPFLALGQGLLQAGANGDNIMLGASNGMLGLEEAQRQEMQDELQGRQFQAQESHYNAQADRWRAEADKERQQQEMFAAYAQGLSPEERPMFMAAPEAFMRQKIETTYRPPAAPTDDQREYEIAKSQGFPGTLMDYLTQLRKAGAASNTISFGAPVAGRDAQGNDVFIRPDNKGGMTIVPGVSPPQRSDANPTQDERQSALLLQRLRRAQGDMSSVITASPDSAKPEVLGSVVGAIGGETARNFANSEDRQRIEAAQMDALDAALTLATGAAYTKDQLEMQRRSHFPQIGDSTATAAEKNKRFTDLVKDAELRSGRATPTNTAPKAPPAPGDGATATNPTTGQKLVRRGGKWEPVQ